MSPTRWCRRCAECARVRGLDIFDRYAYPGVCERCRCTALVCYVEGPEPADLYKERRGVTRDAT